MSYFLHIIFLIEVYSILVLSLNLQLGFSGFANFSIAIFFGFGAYTYAIIDANFSFPFLTICAVAITINFLLSILITIGSAYFKDDVFVLFTFLFHAFFSSIIWNWDSLTGGANGIIGITKPKVFGAEIVSEIDFVILASIFLLLSLILVRLVQKSHFGKILLAIKENETVAGTDGKRIFLFKLKNIALSSSLVSIAGVLFASYTGYIDASNFSIQESLDILLILILGGLLSLKGAIVGAILFFTLQESLKFVGLPLEEAFNLRVILFSAFAVLVLYYRPKGLFGRIKVGQ